MDKLRDILRGYQKVAIAYSGGCDSNFLLNVAIDTLGKENVFAIFCIGEMISREDIINAETLLKDVNHKILNISAMDTEAFRFNHQDRCYHCKKSIMLKVKEAANNEGFYHILDGKNLDDEGEYRPGLKACEEVGILSPLADAKMKKQDIRKYSKELNIITHDKPANACLASRFPYNTELTKEKLEMVDNAESLLHLRGMHYVRVRVHGDIARIEVEKEHFEKIINDESLIVELKKLGFKYVTLDLAGITSGSYDK